MAVCVTDFVQGLLMLLALLFVPAIALGVIGGWDNMANILTDNGVNVSAFLNPMVDQKGSISPINIISQLGWALGYFGMPHISVSYTHLDVYKRQASSR